MKEDACRHAYNVHVYKHIYMCIMTEGQSEPTQDPDMK